MVQGKCKAEGAPEVKFLMIQGKCKAEGAPEVKFSWFRVSVSLRVPLKSSSHDSQCEYTIRLRALLKSSSQDSG